MKGRASNLTSANRVYAALRRGARWLIVAALVAGWTLGLQPPPKAHAAGVVALPCGQAELAAALAAGGGGGLVTFDPLCPAVININTQILINFAVPTVIDGGGRTIQQIGAGQRVFEVAAGFSLTLQNITITGGNVAPANGGGVLVNGGSTLILNNAVITANSANRGGGVYSDGGALTINNSTFSNNQALGDLGGGIYARNVTVTNITNSTFSGNTAPTNGGGLATVVNSTTNITNSTFSGNGGAAAAAVFHAAGGATNINYSTIAFNLGAELGNGGGAVININNSIVGDTVGAANCVGAITSQNFNIDSGNTCGFAQPNDVVNTDPLLGALGNNGGPTQTHALLAGSPAIDTANNVGCPATDQRGTARPQPPGGVCDRGAYESTGVTPVDAVDDNATTPIDTPVVIDVLANDTGPVDPANVTVTVAPASGGTAVNPATGEVTYTPNPGFYGVDTFTYQVCDAGGPGGGNCDTALVTVTVTNTAPVAVDDNATTPIDTPVVIAVLANDTDPEGNIDPASVTVTIPPASGGTAVNPATGEVTYTSNPGFYGVDTFTYQACDTGAPPLCDTALVTVTVTNTAPVAVDDNAATLIDTPVVIAVLANDTDPEGNIDPASVTVTIPPASGGTAVNPATGEVTYTPNPGFSGVDTFTYQVCDTGAPPLCDTALVTVTVSGLVAVDDVTATLIDTPVVIDVLANDLGAVDPASVTVTIPPASGGTAVNPATGEITYTPNPGFSGVDTFTYQVCDIAVPSLCDTALVTVTVSPALADLAVTKIVSNPTPNPGDTIQYQIAVSNGGPDDATNVAVTDLLPAGVTYSTHTASQGTYDPGTGLWAVGDLANGATATLTITATVDAGASGTIINTAQITAADQGDPNAGNNTASVSITVGGAPGPTPAPAGPVITDPAVTKAASVAQAAIGDRVVFTLVAFNPRGDISLPNVVVTDEIGPVLDILEVTATRGTVSVTGNTVTVYIGGMLPNERVTITIVTQVSQRAVGGQIVRNVAIFTDDLFGRIVSNTVEVSIGLGVGRLPELGARPVEDTPGLSLGWIVVAMILIGLGCAILLRPIARRR